MKTLGEFYREKILSLGKRALIKRELPNYSGDGKIERDLFGWRLYSGKNFIYCRSEEEARYLKVFLDARMKEIYVPQDEEYLKSILPELEKLKKKIDEIIDFYTDGIINTQIRERVKYEVYLEITK
jgi:hypothetical protein